MVVIMNRGNIVKINNENIEYSPNATRMLVHVVTSSKKALLNVAGNDIIVQLPTSWHEIEVKKKQILEAVWEKVGQMFFPEALYSHNKECG